MTSVNANLDRFVARMRQRLGKVAATNDDRPFTQPTAMLVNDTEQNLKGVSGWPLQAPLRGNRVRQSERAVLENGSMADHAIRIRSWIRGTAEDERQGLLAFLSVFYGAMVIDGITVRRTAEGRICLSFPERRDGKGRRHSVVRPIDDASRRAIEAAVFGQATMASEVQS